MKKSINSIDPRTKLLLTLIGAIGIVSTHQLPALAIMLVLMIGFNGSIGEWKRYFKWLRLVVPMSIFFGAVIWWSVDFHAGLFAGLKLLTLTTVFFTFFVSTLPEDLANALVKSGLPYPIAFVLSTSLQFVPIMGRKIKNVLDAQRARGIPLEPGWKALRHYPAFFGPILIQSFQMAEELAESMEARGFGRPGRTFIKDYKMGSRDWTVLTLAIIILFGYLSSF